jgi:tRNA A37 threonylcarbamoyladenosine dehydratase
MLIISAPESNEMKIAVIGAGGVGGYFLAKLANDAIL